jgi:hypothetical protein
LAFKCDQLLTGGGLLLLLLRGHIVAGMQCFTSVDLRELKLN